MCLTPTPSSSWMRTCLASATCTKCADGWAAATARRFATSCRPRSAGCPKKRASVCKRLNSLATWVPDSKLPFATSKSAALGTFWARNSPDSSTTWALKPTKSCSPKRSKSSSNPSSRTSTRTNAAVGRKPASASSTPTGNCCCPTPTSTRSRNAFAFTASSTPCPALRPSMPTAWVWSTDSEPCRRPQKICCVHCTFAGSARVWAWRKSASKWAS